MKNIEIKPTGFGHWKITTLFRNKEVSCITTDSISIDNYRSDLSDKQRGIMGQTRKQSATALYNQIIRANQN